MKSDQKPTEINGNPAIETTEPLSIQEAGEWALKARAKADPRKDTIERLRCAAAKRREKSASNPTKTANSEISYKVAGFNPESDAFNVESSDGKKLLGKSISNGNIKSGQKVRGFPVPGEKIIIDVKPKGRNIVIPKPETKPKSKEPTENIKILFYVNIEISSFSGSGSSSIVEALRKEVWIGGTWPVKKIYTTPEGWRLADVFIVNTGEKEEDYVVMGRLFPVKKLHTWLISLNQLNYTNTLETPAAILFTIEKGVVTQQEFAANSCPPHFWRYCGGGFFYSAGSQVGVNSIDTFYGNMIQDWPRKYSWYNGWQGEKIETTPPRGWISKGIASSFTSFAFGWVGMTNPFLPFNNFAPIKPSNNYTPLVSNLDKQQLLQNGAKIFAVDISSSWYFESKNIKTQNINTFYSWFPGDGTAGNMGCSGEFCVTPSKNFSIDYQAPSYYSKPSTGEFLEATGFLYEPLLVNNTGEKTLVIKQISLDVPPFSSTVPRTWANTLLYLSDSGESATFTKISGIPELNNYSTLGLSLFSVSSNNNYTITPPSSQILPFVYLNPSDLLWNNIPVCELRVHWWTGIGTTFPLSSNQSENNKEILYLKEFLLQFAKFVGLTVLPSSDIRETPLSIGYYFNKPYYIDCKYFKPLSSFINNSVYIPYGFLDTNNKFYGTQCLSYSEPEKTRVLPQSAKATVKIVELKLDEGIGEVGVDSNVKELPVYMVTPENTGHPTIALASANYWCKAKTKGKPMPTFTPTPSEVTSTPTP